SLCLSSFVFVSIHWGSGVGVFPAPDHPMLSCSLSPWDGERESQASEVHALLRILDPCAHHFPARSTQINSLSLRAYTCRLAKAGWDHNTSRPAAVFVGSSRCARLSSS